MGWEDTFNKINRAVNVYEIKAPTDESVKLLKELEEKARSKVDETIIVKDSGYEMVVHIENDMLNQAWFFRCHWIANGIKGVTAHKFQYINSGDEYALNKFYSELLKKTVEEITKNVFDVAFMKAIRKNKSITY